MKGFALLHVSNGVVRTGMKCTACKLCDTPNLATNCMSGTGDPQARIMFVGVAPGREDDGIGKPFTGTHGRLFDELIRDAGISRESVYVTNALKCSPYDTKLSDGMFAACKAHLIREISTIKPAVIVSVGAQAMTWLTGQTGVTRFSKHVLQCSLVSGIPVVPISQPMALTHAKGGQRDRLRTELVSDLMWIRDCLSSDGFTVVDEVPLDYKQAKTIEDIHAFFEELDACDELCCDLETTSLFPKEGQVIAAIGFSARPGHARSIPLYGWGTISLHYWRDRELEEVILPKVRRLLKTKKIFGHNFVQFDQKWLRFMLGIDACDIHFDCMLGHYLVDEDKGGHDLETLALQYTKMSPWKADFQLQDTTALCAYLHKDVDATSRIKPAIEAELTHRQKWLLKELLLPLGHTLMGMEYRGIKIQQDNMSKFRAHLRERYKEELNKLRTISAVQAFELAANTTINPNSSKHIAAVMRDYLKLPRVGKTGGGGYSTDRWTLDHYKTEPFVATLQQCRGLTKLLGTYGDGIANKMFDDGRIHTSYLIHGTVTGRLASREPNLQNIPREDTAGKVVEDGRVCKDVFAADDDSVLLEVDFSQAELRTLAMYSRDPALTQIYVDGLDAHAATAAIVNKKDISKVTKAERTGAKNVNFGIPYGMSEDSLIEKFVLAGNTAQAGRDFLATHKQTFPRVWAWMAEQAQTIKTLGYQETYFGRRRHYRGVIDDHMIRAGYNFPIQSTAGDFLLFGMVRSDKRLKAYGIPAWPILTVHDSIVFNVKISHFWEAATVIAHTMENLGFDIMTVPMKVDMNVGYTWGTMQYVDIANRTIGKAS